MSRLRRLRVDAHLSVEELSAITGVAVATIYNLERGQVRNPRLTTIVPLAEHFEVPASELIPDLADDERTEAVA